MYSRQWLVQGVVLGTAWLLADNIIVHLMNEHFPKIFDGMHIAAVDTLHLFPETHAVADEVQSKYGKPAQIYKPRGILSREEFTRVHGDCEQMNHAERGLPLHFLVGLSAHGSP